MIGVIYVITNTITKQRYVGFTKNYKSRKLTHFSTLRNGTHDNKKLQENFSLYGESVFVMDIIEEVPSYADVFDRENYWITHFDSVNNGFNRAKSKGAGFRATDRKVIDRWDEIREIRVSVGATLKYVSAFLGIAIGHLAYMEKGFEAPSDLVDIVYDFYFGLVVSIKEGGLSHAYHEIRLCNCNSAAAHGTFRSYR